MAIVAYTTGFSTLVLKNNNTSKDANIVTHDPKMQLISSKLSTVQSDADAAKLALWHQNADKQTDAFPTSYTVVEDSLIGVMRQRDKGI